MRDKAARRLMDKAGNDDWLAKATFADTAELWRTAAMYASAGAKRAAQAMSRAEDRLRQHNPLLMDAYVVHRAAGMNLADAMRAAAHDAWQHEARANGTNKARPHGDSGDLSPALRANGPAIGATPDPNGMRMVDESEPATRAEVARLAEGVDPELLDRLRRQWRSAGHAPATDGAEHDHAEAGQQQRLGRAFPPLGPANPTHIAGPANTPSTTRQKGSAR